MMSVANREPIYTSWYNRICPACGKYSYHEVREDDDDESYHHARCDNCYVDTTYSNHKEEEEENFSLQKSIELYLDTKEKLDQIDQNLHYIKCDTSGKISFKVKRDSKSLFLSQ